MKNYIVQLASGEYLACPSYLILTTPFDLFAQRFTLDQANAEVRKRQYKAKALPWSVVFAYSPEPPPAVLRFAA